jgi:excinuclease ABC subunit A
MNGQIVLKKVSVHNLKQVDLTLPAGAFIVFTGLSGSGKSSLAFDTIYVEGQRRYIESLPSQARRQLDVLPKPDCESIEGLSPTIAIEQKTVGKNPRSTVGTLTGIYDYFRVLYARLGVAHCPITGDVVKGCSKEEVAKNAYAFSQNHRALILSPLVKGKKGEFKDLFADLEKTGFRRARVDGVIYDLSEVIDLDPKQSHDIDLVIDRLEINKENHSRFLESIFAGLEKGEGLVKIYLVDENEEKLFSTGFYSQKSDTSYPELNLQDFSFNHPEGMCPHCQGLGQVFDYDLKQIIDPKKSLKEDCILVAPSYSTVKWGNIYRNIGEIFDFDVDKPWHKLSPKAQDIILYGSSDKWLKIHCQHPETKARWTDYIKWYGVLQEARRRLEEANSESYKTKMKELMIQATCPVCQGARIKPYPAATVFHGKKIHELTAMTLDDLKTFFSNLKLSETEALVGEELVKEINFCLSYLVQVGIGYLCLDRTAPTLSGGEGQRVRLAAQLGCGLAGITYVLDEPSIGLHPCDNAKLIQTLKDLRDLGNTVIVVEHDEDTLIASDYLVELGPGAGSEGGEIVFQGTVHEILKDKNSLSGHYLKLRQEKAKFKTPRSVSEWIEISGASLHNLNELKAKIPLKVIVGIVGVSGSGKSTLISEILFPLLSNAYNKSSLKTYPYKELKGLEHLDKVIEIDQSPIGKSPRSNPATYVKLWDDIREFFAQLPDSVAMGLTSSHFSFNAKAGSCLSCSGMGMIKIDMDFMDEAFLECPHCQGKRFDQKTLCITYKNKNIYDVLKMTIKEALELFSVIPKIAKKLRTLDEVGLSYLTLGQSSTTLSGGEAQRIKLAKELARPSSGKTLYIFDEPTTGLHAKDIERLLKILETLVDQGNSAWIIEHNLELIKTCDYLIEMGPGAGRHGGKITAEGIPSSFMDKQTPTALALQETKNFSTASPKIKPKFSKVQVLGASEHNLKNVEASINYGEITICSGPSGSGKSSFAFDTVYAEGQRRYADSLPNWAQQFIKLCPKPKIEKITGLLAAIAIEQRGHVGNPRSTIGTLTEIYDYLRILYAQAGEARCPESGAPIKEISVDFVLDELFKEELETKLQILAPINIRGQEDFKYQIKQLEKLGYLRLYINDTLYEIGDEIEFNQRIKNQVLVVIDRIKLTKANKNRLFEALKNGAELGKNELYILIDDKKRYFNLKFAAIDSGRSYPSLTPRSFSFNAEEGMCPTCQGLGQQYSQLKIDSLLDPHSTFLDLFDQLLIGGLPASYEKPLEKFFNKFDQSFYDSTDSESSMILDSGSLNTILSEKKWRLKYRGIQTAASNAALHAKSPYKQRIAPYLSEKICTTCLGQRLNPLSRLVHLGGMTIGSLCDLSLNQALEFIESLPMEADKKEILSQTFDQIIKRLSLSCEIGLGYLSLSRSAATLSGGEAQRVRLSQQLGSGLTGCLYVLDEPTIGLHPHNNHLLNQALLKIKNKGNTLLLVEHDPMTLSIADHILDFGPKAGAKGGYITACGSYQEILANPASLTGQYLSKSKTIPLPKQERKSTGYLEVKEVSLHNLKKVSVKLPLGIMCGITGVSGSGKSSLIKTFCHDAITHGLKTRVDQVEFPFGSISGINQIERLITLTQEPIGTTARGDVSTYVDLLSPLRLFFAQLPQAQSLGLQGKHFSFNHRAGMCQKCYGLGYLKIKRQYLADVRVKCETCDGYRLNSLSLTIKYQGLHLGQILALSVNEAELVLPKVPKVIKRITLLQEVGLGYLPLNQEIGHLSGGEGQRLRLAKELSKRSYKKTLYLLDEPTVGLHPSDIALLIPIFNKMIHSGASFVIIEHNLDVLKCCDYLIELGPGAGSEGGKLIAEGTLRQLINHPSSVTGPYLKKEIDS